MFPWNLVTLLCYTLIRVLLYHVPTTSTLRHCPHLSPFAAWVGAVFNFDLTGDGSPIWILPSALPARVPLGCPEGSYEKVI